MEEIPVSTRALPGQPCQTPPRPEWTKPEKWVWQQVCEGKIADFNTLHKGKLNPRDSDGWSPERLISPEFLETILLHDPFRSALSRRGVCIVGAWVTKPIDLQNARLAHPWSLEKSRLDANVRLSGLQNTDSVSFVESVFMGALCLASAKVGGQLRLNGTKCMGELNMNSLKAGDHLFMSERAEFENVNLVAAKVGGGLVLSEAKCTGELNMDSLEVAGDILMNGAKLRQVRLRGAKVGGQLALNGTKCTGVLNMDSLEVASHLFMCAEAEFGKAIHLIFGNIGGNLDLSGAKLSSIDMTGTRVQGELRLGSGRQPKPIWDGDKESRLILRNAVVGALQDRHEDGAWPKYLDLNGFTYTRLGGFQSEEGGSDMAARRAKWFIEWLEKDQSYTPQPYHQLTNVLRAMGHTEAVNVILYAGKERERHEASGLKWWGLSLLKWVIGYGYGYRYFLSLLWVTAITLIGVLVLATVDSGAPSTLAQKAAFSFDLLLPIIKLDESHKLMFEGWQRYYFYVHQLMGFLLGSFVVAGLSGITKK